MCVSVFFHPKEGGVNVSFAWFLVELTKFVSIRPYCFDISLCRQMHIQTKGNFAHLCVSFWLFFWMCVIVGWLVVRLYYSNHSKLICFQRFLIYESKTLSKSVRKISLTLSKLPWFSAISLSFRMCIFPKAFCAFVNLICTASTPAVKLCNMHSNCTSASMCN